jgi:hypothetical protein
VRKQGTVHWQGTNAIEIDIVGPFLRKSVGAPADMATLQRRLDELGRRSARHHRDLQVLLEVFAVFVKMWLEQTSCVERSDARLARISVDRRYREFVRQATDQLASGPRLIDDMNYALETRSASVVANAQTLPSESPKPPESKGA